MPLVLRSALAAAGVAGAASAAGLAWALAETHRFTMRFEQVAVLPSGSRPMRVLHLSDMHITPSQGDKKLWIRSLADWRPDLVVGTGDFLAHPAAVPVALDALAPLGDFPGLFVLGSNDYYAPKMGNPARYLKGPSKFTGTPRPALPWADLVLGMRKFGWRDLSNMRDRLTVGGLDIDVRGTDDPHIYLDDYPAVAGPFDSAADLRLGVVHAPYARVLEPMTADGADMIIAGHTHGGQLRVPGYGALVTNCDLPRRMARGLHRYPSADAQAGPSTWLEVSAGLGQSPYAPIRFACRPEAILLTLLPVDD